MKQFLSRILTKFHRLKKKPDIRFRLALACLNRYGGHDLECVAFESDTNCDCGYANSKEMIKDLMSPNNPRVGKKDGDLDWSLPLEKKNNGKDGGFRAKGVVGNRRD